MAAEVAAAPVTGNHTIFLTGPAGAGKTTVGVQRMLHLRQQGVPSEQILVWVPQRTLALPYYRAQQGAGWPAGGQVDIVTIGGLARRTLELFWPLVASAAGFGDPRREPCFLTLETAQYVMDSILDDFIAGGAFDGITISRGRLASQVLDNLNKAAGVGFPLDAIGERLKAAWGGESARLQIYDRVQEVAISYRRACLAQNLLDWSLQIEVFRDNLLPLPQLRRYLLSGYRHLILDNVEEDVPVAHDLLRTWLPLCASALVICDADAGFRVFLGADPESAEGLRALCREQVWLSDAYVASKEIQALGAALAQPFGPKAHEPGVDGTPAMVLPERTLRFHTEMVDWVVDRVSRLVHEDRMPPGEIAVLSPFLSEALRFSLTTKLARHGIEVRTHRPSRELREQPAVRCLLTLTKLAHPDWRRAPPTVDVAQALAVAIAEMDPVRAQLLASIVYREATGRPSLSPFHQIVPDTQQRISYVLGGRYDELRSWIQDYVESAPGADRLDLFLSQLFGEVLSQAGFGFHRNLDAGAVAGELIESVRKFNLGPSGRSVLGEPTSPGLEYVDLVERGVVAAQYVSSWSMQPEEAVLVVPAYTFLMMNRASTVQFWLDAGSRAWAERIYQPLTHPYVLSRPWEDGRIWTDEDEVRVRNEALVRVLLGLCRRCRKEIYLAFSELSERGYEQQGPLRQAVQRMLRGHRGPDR